MCFYTLWRSPSGQLTEPLQASKQLSTRKYGDDKRDCTSPEAVWLGLEEPPAAVTYEMSVRLVSGQLLLSAVVLCGGALYMAKTKTLYFLPASRVLGPLEGTLGVLPLPWGKTRSVAMWSESGDARVHEKRPPIGWFAPRKVTAPWLGWSFHEKWPPLVWAGHSTEKGCLVIIESSRPRALHEK